MWFDFVYIIILMILRKLLFFLHCCFLLSSYYCPVPSLEIHTYSLGLKKYILSYLLQLCRIYVLAVYNVDMSAVVWIWCRLC